MVAATIDNIMMVEGEMNEVQESEMLEAIKVAHEAIKVQCKAQLELSEACGKLVKREYCHEVNDDELRKDVHDKCYAKAYAVATSGSGKHERSEAFEKRRGIQGSILRGGVDGRETGNDRSLLSRCRERGYAPCHP